MTAESGRRARKCGCEAHRQGNAVDRRNATAAGAGRARRFAHGDPDCLLTAEASVEDSARREAQVEDLATRIASQLASRIPQAQPFRDATSASSRLPASLTTRVELQDGKVKRIVEEMLAIAANPARARNRDATTINVFADYVADRVTQKISEGLDAKVSAAVTAAVTAAVSGHVKTTAELAAQQKIDDLQQLCQTQAAEIADINRLARMKLLGIAVTGADAAGAGSAMSRGSGSPEPPSARLAASGIVARHPSGVLGAQTLGGL